MIPKPPKWLSWAFAAVMFTGLGLFVGGPILSLAIAESMVDARLSPEELLDPELREQTRAEALAERREKDAWVIPVGMGLASMGTMGLLFLFVTRPLGSDLEKPPPATPNAATESPSDGVK